MFEELIVEKSKDFIDSSIPDLKGNSKLDGIFG
jgi:hypothetical protein